MNNTKFYILIAALVLPMGAVNLFAQNNLPKDYKGIPFEDTVYSKGAQLIPGRVECKYFDLGGESVAYHDKDSINNGSGPYNHQPGHCELGAEYEAYFRLNEGVDLSYTKEMLDYNHINLFEPRKRQGFIGWTNDGEWCNYTVNVKKAGTYNIGILYSNDIKAFKLSLNNKPAGEYSVPLKTGSYHQWNYAEKLGTITFKKAGLNLITLHISGGMNYAYLEFTKQ